MFNGQYTSIKSILAKVVKYPFMEQLTKEDVALYLSEFLRKVGAPIIFNDKVEELVISNYKTNLPSGLLYIKGTRVKTDTLQINDSSKYYSNKGYIALKHGSDIYHPGYHCKETLDECDLNYDFTYILNSGLMYTSFKEGVIQLSYKGLALDDEGYPMIPDDIKVIEALKYYILWQYAEPSFYRKDIPADVYNDIKQQYYFYVGAAQNSLNMPSPDQLKTWENGLIRLFRNTNWHEEGWRNFSSKEHFNDNKSNI